MIFGVRSVASFVDLLIIFSFGQDLSEVIITGSVFLWDICSGNVSLFRQHLRLSSLEMSVKPDTRSFLTDTDTRLLYSKWQSLATHIHSECRPLCHCNVLTRAHLASPNFRCLRYAAVLVYAISVLISIAILAGAVGMPNTMSGYSFAHTYPRDWCTRVCHPSK